MDGGYLINPVGGSDGAPSFMTEKQVAPTQMAVVVQSQPSSVEQQMAGPYHHHEQQHDYTHGAPPACTDADSGKVSFFIFVPGLILMIIGTALIETGAVYPLTITGGSIILAALIYQGIYRSCLGPGPAGHRGYCARLVAYALCAYCYTAWLSLAVTTPDASTAFWIGLPTIVLWLVAFCLLHWESERCRKAKLKAWLDRRPIQISQASVAQLVAAAQAKGAPYFTASFIHLLGEKQVDGEVLNAVLKAEQTQGPDTANARAFFDEMFEGVSIQHKIAAKGILREWAERGVPPQPQLMEPAVLGAVVTTL
eukprot:COSAG06_NODE_971_length_11273_cov_54.583497_8_plen_310_part_00